MKDKIIDIGKVVAILIMFLVGFYFAVSIDPEHSNYEVHGADGKIYHTTRISHGTGRIWFTDENGNRIELGGGYTVIEK